MGHRLPGKMDRSTLSFCLITQGVQCWKRQGLGTHMAGTAMGWNMAGTCWRKRGWAGHSEPRVPYHKPGGLRQPRRAPREESDRLGQCFGKSRVAAWRPQAWSLEPSQGAFRTVSTRRRSLEGSAVAEGRQGRVCRR